MDEYMFLNKCFTTFDFTCINAFHISTILDFKCNLATPLLQMVLNLLLIIENHISIGAN